MGYFSFVIREDEEFKEKTKENTSNAEIYNENFSLPLFPILVDISKREQSFLRNLWYNSVHEKK